jgi:hypothetical protein
MKEAATLAHAPARFWWIDVSRVQSSVFVPADEIDKRYYEKPYYIVPNGKTADEPFAVIRDAMKDKDRVALAGIVMAHREHIMAIEPWGKGMLGTTLRYHYEVRDEKEYFKDVRSPKVPKEMINLASHILETKAISTRVNSKTNMRMLSRRSFPEGKRPHYRGTRGAGAPVQRHQSDGCASPECCRRQRSG